MAVWLVSAALLLDVRAGLGSGVVRGYVTVVAHRNSAPSHKGFPETLWELQVAPTPGARPTAQFNLFLDRMPQQLVAGLEAEGVQARNASAWTVPGANTVSRWEDRRHPYRIAYAGLGRRVPTRLEPLR